MFVFLPILTLLGCIEASSWPSSNGEDRIEDTAESVQTTPTLPCNSADQGTVAALTVQNPTSAPYQLSVMDPYCQEQFVVTVQPQEAYNTNVGNHVFWVVRDDNGEFVRFFGIPSGSNVQWVEVLP